MGTTHIINKCHCTDIIKLWKNVYTFIFSTECLEAYFSWLKLKTIIDMLIFSNFLGKPSASSWSRNIAGRAQSFQGGICCQCKIEITVRTFWGLLETFLYLPPNTWFSKLWKQHLSFKGTLMFF